MSCYVAYDFTNQSPGEMFEEWNKQIELCPACGRAGFDDSDAIPDGFVHVMGREEDCTDKENDLWKPVSMFFVHDYCNKVTTDWSYTELVKELPNRVKHPRTGI